MQKDQINSPDSFPLHRYKPIRKLGAGGAGVVYLCRDKLLDRDVSVKVLTFGSCDRIVDFQREAQVTAKLRHPNIVSILDFGITDDGTPFMVLEFIEGISLNNFVEEGRDRALDTYLKLILQVADALEFSHKAGIFHRDIKPANIILSKTSEEDWHARLIDFGIALLEGDQQQTTRYRDQSLIGTPAYMPPDLVLGRSYSERSEIYSLGCVLFELLFGHPPFEGATAIEVISKHAQEPIPEMTDSSVPQAVKDMIAKCLSKDPDERFQNMQELKRAVLEELADTEPADSEPLSQSEPVSARTSSPRLNYLIPVVLCAALGLIVVLFGSLMFQQDKKTQTKTKTETRSSIAYGKSINYKPKCFADKPEDGKLSVKTVFQIDGVVSDKDLVELKNHVPIYRLDLSDTACTGEGFALVPDLEVEELNLDTCPVTETGLKKVASIKGLTTLFLFRSDLISTGGLANLCGSKTLTTVVYSGKNLSEESFLSLRSLNALLGVQPADMHVTKKGAGYLASLPHLNNIIFRLCEVDADTLTRLSEMKQLKSIGFDACTLTGSRLDALLKMPVDEINIGNCELSRAGLKKLRGNKKINTLTGWCTGATEEEISSLIGSFKDLPPRAVEISDHHRSSEFRY